MGAAKSKKRDADKAKAGGVKVRAKQEERAATKRAAPAKRGLERGGESTGTGAPKRVAASGIGATTPAAADRGPPPPLPTPIASFTF